MPRLRHFGTDSSLGLLLLWLELVLGVPSTFLRSSVCQFWSNFGVSPGVWSVLGRDFLLAMATLLVCLGAVVAVDLLVSCLFAFIDLLQQALLGQVDR